MASVKAKRKQWTPESMQEACKAVKDENMCLCEAARKYSVSVETLRRRTAGLVSLECFIKNLLTLQFLERLSHTCGELDNQTRSERDQ